MESVNPLKTLNFPGFRARAQPAMRFRVRFWAEKLILVIINQFIPIKARMNTATLHFPSVQLSIARFLGDPGQFNRPELPVDRFSCAQKHFFINTNNVKGYLLQQRESHCCLEPPRHGLQKNSVFRPKMAIFRLRCRGSNVVRMCSYFKHFLLGPICFVLDPAIVEIRKKQSDRSTLIYIHS